MKNVATIADTTFASPSDDYIYIPSDINDPPPSLTDIRNENNKLNAMIELLGASCLNKV